MPKNIAQWTGFAVTMIIVLGRDADVLTAVPLGIAAGMLATLFQEAMRMQLRPVRLLLGPRASRPPARPKSLRRGEGPQGPLSLRDADGTSAVPVRFDLHHPVTSMVRAVNSFRPKWRHAQFRE